MMGQLIDGVWSDEDILSEIQADGSYLKKPSIFRRFITADGSSGFKGRARPLSSLFVDRLPLGTPYGIVSRHKKTGRYY